MTIHGYHVLQGIANSGSGYQDIGIPTGFAVKKYNQNIRHVTANEAG
jgi:hypothetical protein